jgi:hypothetical protein
VAANKLAADCYSCNLSRFWGRAGEVANFLSGAHSVECAGHDLGRARATHVIGRFGFEQLGMSEDDAELIVQSVEQKAQFLRFVHRFPGEQCHDTEHTPYQACGRPSGSQAVDSGADWLALFGSRQRESAKIRTEPPAVRTYSILPLASQL